MARRKTDVMLGIQSSQFAEMEWSDTLIRFHLKGCRKIGIAIYNATIYNKTFFKHKCIFDVNTKVKTRKIFC
jgi:hypothetical protein